MRKKERRHLTCDPKVNKYRHCQLSITVFFKNTNTRGLRLQDADYITKRDEQGKILYLTNSNYYNDFVLLIQDRTVRTSRQRKKKNIMTVSKAKTRYSKKTNTFQNNLV